MRVGKAKALITICDVPACSHPRPERLSELKALAKEYLKRPEVKARAEELRRVLGGESNSGWPSVVGVGSGSLQGEGDTSQVSPSSP